MSTGRWLPYGVLGESPTTHNIMPTVQGGNAIASRKNRRVYTKYNYNPDIHNF